MFEGYKDEEPFVQTVQYSAPVLDTNPLLFHDVHEAKLNDVELGKIYERLQQGDPCPPYLLKQGLVCFKIKGDDMPKVVIPAALIAAVLKYYHDSVVGGHLGILKTLSKIREHFTWKGIFRDVANYVRTCKICGLSKPAQKLKYDNLASTLADRPMEKWFVDFVGKFPRSKKGNTYILTVVDAFSKFCWLVPVREATTKSALHVLKGIIASFGCPRILVTDNATQFISNDFRKFCFGTGIQHITTGPYYPNPSQGERVNRNLRSALIAYHSHDHTSWDSQLDWLQFAFDSARHQSHKLIPFSLIMAYPPQSPLSNLWLFEDLLPDSPDPQQLKDLWTTARRNLRMNHKVSAHYDQGRHPVPFHIGDSVYLRHHPVSNKANQITAKLTQRYKGPYKIVALDSPVTFRLQDDKGITVRAHASQLKHIHSPTV
ncbi:hypothetical protein ANN_14182 [Periplaneta americana]|uniref:RNA-directed DNA polymerase n=1 Tax=Periplaneta americana TaxID=6978 RepID=A0ABQ8SWT7_PERAM|nr:hypothetical protein ANN_14182 [Periplaneta americana]